MPSRSKSGPAAKVSTDAPGADLDVAHTSVLPRLVDMDTVAAALGVTTRHIRRLVAERRLPFVKVGYFVRFDPVHLARRVDQHRVDVHPPPKRISGD